MNKEDEALKMLSDIREWFAQLDSSRPKPNFQEIIRAEMRLWRGLISEFLGDK